ncbi:MAG: hypothetical protein H0V45_03735, partial [Actinobacteria bacterium]|nr:hypothetical protein [Actinomycetota bacterium]
LNPGATILVDRRAELTGAEDESLIDIKLIEGEPRPEAEKVTVPPEVPAEADEAPDEE